MKTDNAALVGVHKFEAAGMGKAPFRFVGITQNIFKPHPDAPAKPGGSCDYCATAITDEFHIVSADGKRSKVGCNCIAKVGDAGLIQSYKSSPEFRAFQRAKNAAKAKATTAELATLIATHVEKLATLPHPQGFSDRQTGKALTLLDQAKWIQANAGHAGRNSMVSRIKRTIAL